MRKLFTLWAGIALTYVALHGIGNPVDAHDGHGQETGRLVNTCGERLYVRYCVIGHESCGPASAGSGDYVNNGASVFSDSNQTAHSGNHIFINPGESVDGHPRFGAVACYSSIVQYHPKWDTLKGKQTVFARPDGDWVCSEAIIGHPNHDSIFVNEAQGCLRFEREQSSSTRNGQSGSSSEKLSTDDYEKELNDLIQQAEEMQAEYQDAAAHQIKNSRQRDQSRKMVMNRGAASYKQRRNEVNSRIGEIDQRLNQTLNTLRQPSNANTLRHIQQQQDNYDIPVSYVEGAKGSAGGVFSPPDCTKANAADEGKSFVAWHPSTSKDNARSNSGGDMVEGYLQLYCTLKGMITVYECKGTMGQEEEAYVNEINQTAELSYQNANKVTGNVFPKQCKWIRK